MDMDTYFQIQERKEYIKQVKKAIKANDGVTGEN